MGRRRLLDRQEQLGRFPEPTGFLDVAYANETRIGAVQGIMGTAYFTGTMYFTGTDYTNTANLHTGIDATATWKGTSNSVWNTNTANWQNNGTGAALTWVNQEIGTTFDNSTASRSIAISGTAIAHSLTFSAGATGYFFNGGALTVTAGGITTSENVTILSPITIGGPQAWTVAAGKTLTVGSIHTVISNLTLNGAGNTTITGMVDGGGAANLEGQPAGQIIQQGPGTLTLTAAASCDTIVYSGGTLSLGMTGTNFSGGLDLAGPLLPVTASSTVSGGVLTCSPLCCGSLILTSGTLQDDGGGRTLANPVTINGNVTLSSAGAAGVSFSPLGLTTPNAVTMDNSPTITVAAPTTIGDPINGSSGFTMNGPSVLTLTATASSGIGGAINVSGGTLQGTAANMLTPIVLANNANVTYPQNANATLTMSIGGTGSVTKSGSGLLTFGAACTYRGATTINGGTLQLAPAARHAGLVVHYTMDGPLGNIAAGTTILDTSPAGNHGPWPAPGPTGSPGSSARAFRPTRATSRARTAPPSTVSKRGRTRCGSISTTPTRAVRAAAFCLGCATAILFGVSSRRTTERP